MPNGTPRVDLAALVELKRLLKVRRQPAHSRSDIAIVREERDEVSKVPAASRDRQMNLVFDDHKLEGLGSRGAGQGRSRILAQILMQAAGLHVEELEDDKR